VVQCESWQARDQDQWQDERQQSRGAAQHLTGVLVDAERVFDAAELQRVLSSERRDELPGAPLKLEVAFDNLVAQLTRGTVQVPAR
jgi:hypothetical protein